MRYAAGYNLNDWLKSLFMNKKHALLLIAALVVTNIMSILTFIFFWNTMYIGIEDRFYPSFTKPKPISIGSLNAAFGENSWCSSSSLPHIDVLGNPFYLLICVNLNKGIERQVFLKTVIIRKLSDNSILFERKINQPLISRTQNNNKFLKIDNLYLPSTDLGISVLLEINGVEEKIEHLNFKFTRQVYSDSRILVILSGV